MNWLLFAITSYVFLLLQIGLKPLLGVPDAYGASPNFLLILAVFIGLSAQSKTVAWGMLTLGIVANLIPGPEPTGTILGPVALGYLAGAFAVLQLRTLVFRESVVSLAILVFVVGIIIQLVTVALYTGRGLPIFLDQPIPNWSAIDELFQRFWELLYSAIAAVPLGFILMRLQPSFNFTPNPRERSY
tara:strand:- start:225 stop:785 length:561 start_codon:yes stop_codon:yes gene_type:complete